MDSFTIGMRVEVSDQDHPMQGRAGTVLRVRARDRSGWVEMDDPAPAGVRVLADFATGTGMSRTVELWPDQCRPEGRTVGPASAPPSALAGLTSPDPAGGVAQLGLFGEGGGE